MLLKILVYPDPRLAKKASPVEKISKEVFKLVDDMIETMLKNEGLGLAANQVGSGLRIFVINAAPGGETPRPMAVINPQIVSESGSVIEEEGCLSFPGLYVKVARAEEVRVQGKNLFNEDIVLEATGFLARAVMHEIDHLNGILFIKKAAPEEKPRIKEYLESLENPKAAS